MSSSSPFDAGDASGRRRRCRRCDFGNGFGFWNTMPMRRRTSTGSTLRRRRGRRRGSASVPSTRAPSMRSFIRLKQRSTVVLPQPDGPMNAVISCWRIVEVDVAHGPERAVVDREVLDVEHDRRGRPPVPTIGRPSSAVVGRRDRSSVDGVVVVGVGVWSAVIGASSVGHRGHSTASGEAGARRDAGRATRAAEGRSR